MCVLDTIEDTIYVDARGESFSYFHIRLVEGVL